MIRKGNGTQPDNICRLILIILSKIKACDCYCHLILIDLPKNRNCNCYAYLIRNYHTKKLELFVKVALRMVAFNKMNQSVAFPSTLEVLAATRVSSRAVARRIVLHPNLTSCF